MRIPLEKMHAKAGGTVADHFDRIDTDRDGRIRPAELFSAAELAEGLAVPPSPSPRRSEPEHLARGEAINCGSRRRGAALQVSATNGPPPRRPDPLRSCCRRALRRLALSVDSLGRSWRTVCRLRTSTAKTRASCTSSSVSKTKPPPLTERRSSRRPRWSQAGRQEAADFIVNKKIGGKDIAALGGGASQSSRRAVCSYVYLAQMRSGPAVQLALKVMLNYEEDMPVMSLMRRQLCCRIQTAPRTSACYGGASLYG